MKKIIHIYSEKGIILKWNRHGDFIILLWVITAGAVFRDNPDFMSQFRVKRDKIYMLRDRLFQEILRKIKKCERGL